MNFSNDNYCDLGFAKLDLSRKMRTGLTETIFCLGKTQAQLLKILKEFDARNCSVLGTKCSKEQADYVAKAGLLVKYDEISKIIVLRKNKSEKRSAKTVAVCTAGTADLPIAEEAAQTLEFFGVSVNRYFDIGIAGLHRLLSNIENIRKSEVIIAVAGMEGALAGVIAGLTYAPVIAVPTSIGYGASFSGLSALLTMLNTCAEGVSVVNIDNGFGAAISAYRMLNIK